MQNQKELDDGLAAFDRLAREMVETNHLLRAVRSDQATRNQQEHDLAAEMKTALKQATGAAQKTLQASQTEIRSSSTLDGSDDLPDRSGGVWRWIFLRSAGRMGQRARGRIPESPESGGRRELGEHTGRTASLWSRSTWQPRSCQSVHGP